MLQPVLTYTTDTRGETKRAKQKIRTTEIKVLGPVTIATLRDKQTDDRLVRIRIRPRPKGRSSPGRRP